jgi:hypothetical protein
MQNILLVWITPGEPTEHGFALVSSRLLEGFDFDRIDGKILNMDEMSDEIGDQIQRLYVMLGLEPSESAEAGTLAKLIDQPMLGIPDRVVKFGWSV